MTHSIGEIEWDETDPLHIVGQLVVAPAHGGRVRYEFHVYAPRDDTPSAWCELYYAFGDFEFHNRTNFREETVEMAKAALARQVELEWR